MQIKSRLPIVIVKGKLIDLTGFKREMGYYCGTNRIPDGKVLILNTDGTDLPSTEEVSISAAATLYTKQLALLKYNYERIGNRLGVQHSPLSDLEVLKHNVVNVRFTLDKSYTLFQLWKDEGINKNPDLLFTTSGKTINPYGDSSLVYDIVYKSLLKGKDFNKDLLPLVNRYKMSILPDETRTAREYHNMAHILANTLLGFIPAAAPMYIKKVLKKYYFKTLRLSSTDTKKVETLTIKSIEKELLEIKHLTKDQLLSGVLQYLSRLSRTNNVYSRCDYVVYGAS